MIPFEITGAESEGLKPCPCCGGKVAVKPYTSKGIVIQCSNCAVQLRQKVRMHDTEWLYTKMKETWNKRPQL